MANCWVGICVTLDDSSYPSYYSNTFPEHYRPQVLTVCARTYQWPNTKYRPLQQNFFLFMSCMLQVIPEQVIRAMLLLAVKGGLCSGLACPLSHGNSRCGLMLHTGACPCIRCATTASLPLWSQGLCLQKGWNLLLVKFPPSTAEATGEVLQASNVFCTLPRKNQTLPFPSHTEGMSLSAVLLLMLRSVGMNQKVAKLICLIFQGSKDWVDSSNPCFTERGIKARRRKQLRFHISGWFCSTDKKRKRATPLVWSWRTFALEALERK